MSEKSVTQSLLLPEPRYVKENWNNRVRIIECFKTSEFEVCPHCNKVFTFMTIATEDWMNLSEANWCSYQSVVLNAKTQTVPKFSLSQSLE